MRVSKNHADVKAAAAIVRKAIKGLRPEMWYGERDGVGHKVNVHYDDGEHAATVNYETIEWVTYELLDAINDKLEAADLPIEAEYLSRHEVALMLLLSPPWTRS